MNNGSTDIPADKLPNHVAIIMDGNGRWARARGLERVDGHAEGANAVREAVKTSRELEISYLTLYAFSVANWNRPTIEIEALMRLLVEFAEKEKHELRENGIRVNIIGEIEDLPTSTRHAVEHVIDYCADGDRMCLTLALSYGGRQDIINAVRSIAVRARAGLVLPEEIDEVFLHHQMTTHTLPDVDLLIRTGGEARLSDFLLYESAYAELMFLDLMWPDFKKAVFHDCVRQYATKERRFGRTSQQVADDGVISFQPLRPTAGPR